MLGYVILFLDNIGSIEYLLWLPMMTMIVTHVKSILLLMHRYLVLLHLGSLLVLLLLRDLLILRCLMLWHLLMDILLIVLGGNSRSNSVLGIKKC